jgi:hypothetical protein
MLLQAAQLFAGLPLPADSCSDSERAQCASSVPTCARAWAASVCGLPAAELSALSASLATQGFALLPPTPAALALAAALRCAARPAAASAGAADAAFEPTSDGARVQGKARAWEAALHGLPQAMHTVVQGLLAAGASSSSSSSAQQGQRLQASLVQPFLALPGASSQAWHRDCRGDRHSYSVLLHLCSVPASCATLVVPGSHSAQLMQPAQRQGAQLPEVAAAGEEGSALVFTHALVHRGQSLGEGRGLRRLFGYVMGSSEGGQGASEEDLEGLGYQSTAVAGFEEEEVEWPMQQGME